jgi:hypothetical protein
MKGPIRLDEVAIFGEKLRFLIPHEWVEGESDDPGTYLYHAPETDSGWLRVSLITVQANDPKEKLRTLFNEAEDVFVSSKMGNKVNRYEKDTQEEGTRIHLFYWKVANIVPPDLVREALFSYTILAERQHWDDLQQTVELIEQLVSEAVFVPTQ